MEKIHLKRIDKEYTANTATRSVTLNCIKTALKQLFTYLQKHHAPCIQNIFIPQI